MTAYKLPNGTTCYTGPSCRLHGMIIQVAAELASARGTAAQNSPLSELQEQFTASLQECRVFACNNQTRDIQTLEELGEDSLLKSVAVQKCELHNTYHVFNREQGNNQLRVFAKNHAVVSQSSLPSDQKSLLHAELTEDMETLREHLFHDELLRQHRINIQGSDLIHKAEQKRISELNAWHAANPSSPKPSKEAGIARREKKKKNVVLTSDKVSPELLIQYYSCARKTPHPNQEQAQHALEVTRTDDNDDSLSMYRCNYGDHYHIGHHLKSRTKPLDGTADIPTEETRRNAAIYWDTHPKTANAFAVKHGLI